MTRFIVNVEAAVWRDGTFLMIERGEEEEYGAGWLSFPGGKVDWEGEGEDVLERTAARELLEEVALDLPGPWFLAESKNFGTDDSPVLDVVMMAQWSGGEAKVNSPGEVANLAWMSPAEIRSDPRTQPWTLQSLLKLEATAKRLGW